MSFPSGVLRLRIPPRLRASVLGAVGRLELKFDPRIGLKRVKRYQFDLYTETIPYALLFLVSPALVCLTTARTGSQEHASGASFASSVLGLTPLDQKEGRLGLNNAMAVWA